MSELTGNGFLAGASASAINEMVQKKLAEQFEGEPDKHQWASAIIGGIVSQLVADNAQAGASTAASGTKNNDYGFRPDYSKNEGFYIYKPGKGWYIVKNGEDVYTNEMPPEGVPYWQQDLESNLGWDYIRYENKSKKIDDKILYCKYVIIDDKAYGITIYEYNDDTKKAIIKNGMTMLAGALLAKNANSFDSIDALFNNINIKDGIDYKAILDSYTIENLSNYLMKAAGR